MVVVGAGFAGRWRLRGNASPARHIAMQNQLYDTGTGAAASAATMGEQYHNPLAAPAGASVV